MTLQSFIDKYTGQTKGYPTDKNYNGECLSIVKLYIKECFGISPPPSGSNSAYGYWSNFPSPLDTVFEKVANDPKLVPLAGDIIIWNTKVGNGYGHIAIFVSGSVSEFVSFDQNYYGRQAHLQKHGYNNVVGWLTPKKNMTNELTDDQKRILQFLTESKADETKVREAFGALKDLPNVTKELDDLKTSHIALEARVVELETNLVESQKYALSWQKESQIANKLATKLQAELEISNEEKQTWKNRYETALKKTIDKYSAWKLFVYTVRKIMGMEAV